MKPAQPQILQELASRSFRWCKRRRQAWVGVAPGGKDLLKIVFWIAGPRLPAQSLCARLFAHMAGRKAGAYWAAQAVVQPAEIASLVFCASIRHSLIHLNDEA